MATWWVTTGISLLESSRCWGFNDEVFDSRLGSSDHLTGAQIWESSEFGPEFLIELARRKRKLFLTPVDNILKNYRKECWNDEDRFRALPAELSTLWKIVNRKYISTGDKVCFVVGKSNKKIAELLYGMLAVHINENEMGFTASKTETYVLDPTNNEHFLHSMSSLWEEISPTLCDSKLVLTGGYKAVLIELSRRIGESRYTVPIYYAHEEQTGSVIEMKTVGGARTVTVM